MDKKAFRRSVIGREVGSFESVGETSWNGTRGPSSAENGVRNYIKCSELVFPWIPGSASAIVPTVCLEWFGLRE